METSSLAQLSHTDQLAPPTLLYLPDFGPYPSEPTLSMLPALMFLKRYHNTCLNVAIVLA